MHGRTISLPCSQEGWGNSASLAQPQLHQQHNHAPHQQPLCAAPCPCWVSSCRLQPGLWDWDSYLHGALGPAASILAEQGTFGPEQCRPALELDSLFSPSCEGPSSRASSAAPQPTSPGEGRAMGQQGGQGMLQAHPRGAGTSSATTEVPLSVPQASLCQLSVLGQA